MMFVRFNLLSDDQLAGVGFSEKEITLIRHARPLESLADLWFLEGVDAVRAVPRLVSQAILVGLADWPLLPPDRWLALRQDAEGGADGDQGEADDEVAPGATGPALATGEGWTVTSAGGATFGAIADCTTTKTFRVTATKGARQGEPGNRDYDRFKAPTEKEATDGAKQRLTLGIASIIAGCECIQPNCLKQILGIQRNLVGFAYSQRYRGPLPDPRVRGWEARAVATAIVTITCQ
jgi:hypothetical protein